jgi:hypothetical protein
VTGARLVLALALASATAGAHVVSMSTGEARLDESGTRLHYRLSIPAYETQHMKSPAADLAGHIAFSSDGVRGRESGARCAEDKGAFICDIDYEFPRPVDRLDVECRFPSLGLPTHVHLLRAFKGPNAAQAAFDASFTRAELAFRPPSAAERATRAWVAGFAAVVRSAATMLLLAALLLGMREWRAGARLMALLPISQVAAVVAFQRFGWNPALRFGEAAVAVAAAYIAFEVVLAPPRALRWWIWVLAGVFAGVRLAALLNLTESATPWYLGGAVAAQLFLLCAVAGAAWLLRKVLQRPALVRLAACLLIAAAMLWFALQL